MNAALSVVLASDTPRLRFHSDAFKMLFPMPSLVDILFGVADLRGVKAFKVERDEDDE